MGNKIYYYCPVCGDEVWAWKGWENNKCWDCRLSGRTQGSSGSKGPAQVAESNNIAKKSRKEFLGYYTKNDKEVKISGYTFKNVVPKGSSSSKGGWYHVQFYNKTYDMYVV